MSGIKQTYHIGCENVGQRIPNVSTTGKNGIALFEKNIENYNYDWIYKIVESSRKIYTT